MDMNDHDHAPPLRATLANSIAHGESLANMGADRQAAVHYGELAAIGWDSFWAVQSSRAAGRKITRPCFEAGYDTARYGGPRPDPATTPRETVAGWDAFWASDEGACVAGNVSMTDTKLTRSPCFEDGYASARLGSPRPDGNKAHPQTVAGWDAYWESEEAQKQERLDAARARDLSDALDYALRTAFEEGYDAGSNDAYAAQSTPGGHSIDSPDARKLTQEFIDSRSWLKLA